MSKHEKKAIFVLCEGAAERAIIDILLDHDKLIFTRDELNEREPLRVRSGKNFERDYLNKSMDQVQLYRVLDSKKEATHFNLSKAYAEKVEVINLITAPEIEMLIIIAANKFDEYRQKYSHMKPSEYVTQFLKIKHVKSSATIKKIFSDVELLCSCIREHKRLSQGAVKKNIKYLDAILKD